MTRRTIALGINVDHIATLRNARNTPYPDVVAAAQCAEAAGADCITVHLREDRRHILDNDVRLLKNSIARLNLEMAVTDEMVTFACAIRPHECCFVPEKRQELTTEGGLDILTHKDRIEDAVRTVRNAGIAVSLFVDADEKQIDAARIVGADTVELHTGHYANAATTAQRKRALDALHRAATIAHLSGLTVNAGHGLHTENVLPVAHIPEIRFLHIGHAVIARAVFVGLTAAIQEMRAVLDVAR